jgi:translation initiation factor IF-2
LLVTKKEKFFMAETSRPPIVTILGHVDHGKTTLLDFIRKAAVAQKEHGGITQAIGAYQVTHEGKLITFIDTPGHAAFEKMRSRGAQVADIAVLVVAIDDGIMPQTVEAIKHIKKAGVAMVVAVNKIDIPGINKIAQMEKLKKQLSDHEVLIEEYGGDVPIVQLSAKTGEGVDKLLEIIQLVSEVNDFKGDPSLPASGVVIEANIDKFKGPIATVIIRNGTLKKNQQIKIAGAASKIRTLVDFTGKQIDEAPPSTPVELLGLEIVPPVGGVLGDESAAMEAKQDQIQSLLEKMKQKDQAVLNVVVKADKQGSLEAIEGALEAFNDEREVVKVIDKATGDISDKDIKLAASTGAIVIGFGVKVGSTATKIAENEGVLVRTYNIIYELIEELEDVVEGMLKVGALEEIFGTAQIVAEFPFGKTEKIAGCKVLDGTITKGPKVKVIRGEQIIGEGKIKSLKKVKNEVNRVEKGDECGIMFDSPIEFLPGDLIQSFRTL